MRSRMILVGTGGWGRCWCQRFLPPNVEGGLVEVVAAVDVDRKALRHARRYLKLPPERCYTDVRKAFDENPAEFCAVVVPPAAHEAVIDEALAHRLHVLCEKPIADTLAGAVRIAQKVKAAGKKMGVTMTHRFDQDKTTLRHVLRCGDYGPLDYLVFRFTIDTRKYGSWGDFRHKMADPLMIDGAVHHLDILADLAGAKCDTIYAQTWNPPWGEFAGDSQGLVVMRFANGVRASYEGAATNAVGLNGWGKEYIRAEFENTTLILNRRRLERFDHDPSRGWKEGREGRGAPIPLLEQPKWGNVWLIEKFVRWLDGGEPMETNVADNLQSMALVFAAIESSRTGQAVPVQGLLGRAQSGDKTPG